MWTRESLTVEVVESGSSLTLDWSEAFSCIEVSSEEGEAGQSCGSLLNFQGQLLNVVKASRSILPVT